MAVVDEEKVEKAKNEKADRASKADEDQPTGIAGVIGWLPRKVGEGRAFLSEVRSELKKVNWPSRKEVYSTTIVVIATSVFFGFYLWGLDIAMSRALEIVFKRQF